jgi:outer membrane protein OmpA-like peptidoglycan-associated protein
MNKRIKNHNFSFSPILKMTTLTLFAAMLGACSSMPDRNAALDQARSRLNLAQGDSQVAALAPDELSRAGESLRVADKAWTDGNSPVTVDHLAYMASQRVTIAQETASSKASQTTIANAGAERDRMRLESRTMEAESAKRDLTVSQQNSAMKSTQLANAEASANATAAATALREQESAMRNAAAINDLQSQLSELNAKKTDRGMVVTLGDVLFATGDAKLLAAGNNSMVKLAEAFKSNPQRKATIEGYTDSVGAPNANYTLSERRASSVMMALTNLGVPADRLSTRAHGEDDPVADNGTAVGRQMNRRVEIVFAP